ncbi:hypothetical protein CANMA_001830 [Candida margitis]|uniref:uncharacterized protein n=1 Tax=Candida margitis TaxID=1775924 RepID=UPI0022263292|nr:uncharacterized protein CANMA_001830 [Candida margitis]KAI5969163.1 hypothetical protein CANMA_001830 [Candida margitis]
MALQIFLPSTKVNDKTLVEDLNSVRSRREVYFYEEIQGYIVCNESERKSDVITLNASVHTQDSNREASNRSNYIESDGSTNLKLDQTNVVYQNEGTKVWMFTIPSVQPPSKRTSGPYLLLSCRFIEDSNIEPNGEEIMEDVVLTDYKPVVQDLETVNRSPSKDSSVEVVTKEVELEKDNIAEISIPIRMALVIKMKSTKPAGRNGMLLVALTVERSEEMAAVKKSDADVLYFNINSFELSSDNGIISPIHQLFPSLMGFDDSINIVYKLDNNEQAGRETSKQILITMNSTIQKRVNDNYVNLSNPIRTNWRPYLDLGLIAPPINNALKTNNNTPHLQSQISNSVNGLGIRQKAMLNTIYKMESPTFSNLNTNSSNNIGKRAKSFVTRESSSVTVNLSTNVNSSLAGLRLTFIGRLDMKQGVVTQWKIQAINNSINRLNLSLLVQNPINFNPIYSSAASNNNFSSSNLLNNDSKQSNQDILIYNRAQLYSLYNTLKVNTDADGVIILNNDIRIGPLEPQASFETSLNLIGNTKGIFSLDGIKIFDVASGDGLDFGKLIEVFVV